MGNDDDGSNKVNSHKLKEWAPRKKSVASVGWESMVHTTGNPMVMVANRLGTSAHRDEEEGGFIGLELDFISLVVCV